MHNPARDNGAAPADLNSILTQDKSLQDVLGDVTRSDLPRNVVLAAALTFGLVAVLTVGPYLYKRFAPAKVVDKDAVADQTPAAPVAPDANAKAPAKTTEPAGKSPVADPFAIGGEKGEKAKAAPVGRDPLLDRLDVGQTKNSDPKKNPLDKANDDLLKDLK